MNIKQFANVDSYLRDLDNGNKLEYREYMGRVVNKIGADNIKPYIPYDIKTLVKAYKKDIHFNVLHMREWDIAAEQIHYVLHRNGITTYSLSDRVCILKETARILCEMEMNNNVQIRN